MKTTSGHTTYLTAYKFNGKEMDAETGLYYYGARYYEPELAMWYGVDALAEKYVNITPYHYCFDNPIRFIDPDGNDGKATVDYENNTIVIEQNFYYNKNDKNLQYFFEENIDNINSYGFSKDGGWKIVIDDKEWMVSFQNTFVGLSSDEEVDNALKRDDYGTKVEWHSNLKSKNGKEAEGLSNGKTIKLCPASLHTNQYDVGTFVHEQGHTLGLHDTKTFDTGEAMSYIKTEVNRKIQPKEIQLIIQPIINSNKKIYHIKKQNNK